VKLYGSLLHPLVRRVRIVAEEVGAEYTFVDASTPEGDRAMRAVSPIGRYPVLQTEAEVLLDWEAMVETLLERYGRHALRTARKDQLLRERSLLSAIDALLDSAIVRFHLSAEGVDVGSAPYLEKQRARDGAALVWLDAQLIGDHFTEEPRIGLPEIALVSALDWIEARGVYAVEPHASLARFRRAHASRPSFASTAPR
jgi:glutathione S-transferase